MKKKLISLLLSLCCVLTLGSCGANPKQNLVELPERGQTKEEERTPISKDSVKILAIGNSFSDNAMNQMYSILQAFGAKEIVLGNMYIGGCSVETHYNNAVNDSASYQYRKNDSRTAQAGQFVTTGSTKLSTALTDEDWQFVTLQQASDFSGVVDTYNAEQLNYLVELVKKSVANDNLKVGWHMTWAYAENSTHSAFPKYNRDQQTMYEVICACVKQTICNNDNFDFIIPAGTAIQNARTSYVGDQLTADGYHLNTLGEYIIGLTWVMEITGWSIEDLNLDYVPSEFKNDIEMIKEAAVNALKNPYTVTQSECLEKPTVEIDLSGYQLLEWEPKLGFWNSSASDQFIDVDAIANQFVSTSVRFSREDLPVGTIIMIESGYGYRPDGWNTESGKSTAARPANVTTEMIVVDEEWWGDYLYRGFNIFVSPNRMDMTDLVEETAAKLKIYVPIEN